METDCQVYENACQAKIKTALFPDYIILEKNRPCNYTRDKPSKASVRLTLDWCEQGLLSQAEALTKLGIKCRQFFTLLKSYLIGKLKQLAGERTNAHRKLSSAIKAAIHAELEKDKQLI